MSEQASSQIRQFMYDGWRSQAVYAAAKLGLADLIAGGTGSVAELSERTGTDADYLYRLLRALAGNGIFLERSGRSFAMNPAAECLLTDGADTVKDLVLFYGLEVYRSFGRIVESVQSGDTAFDHEYGMPLWEYLRAVPESGTTFRRGMGASSWREQLPLARTYGFAGIKCLVDVGGGEGTMLAAILHQHPEMRGVLVEIPSGIDRTMRHFTEAGVADRCTLVEGSAFNELPPADGYLMSCVLHTMDDETCLSALRQVRAAVQPGGRLVVVERVVGPANEPDVAKLLDLTMMVMNGGRERTEPQWRELLARASFTLAKIVFLPYFSGGAELAAIEAIPG